MPHAWHCYCLSEFVACICQLQIDSHNDDDDDYNVDDDSVHQKEKWQICWSNDPPPHLPANVAKTIAGTRVKCCMQRAFTTAETGLL